MQMPAGTEKIGIDIYANGNAPKGSCIRAISQIDRTFFMLCRPALWKVLDLRRLPTAALGDFYGDSETLTRRYLRNLVQDLKTGVMIFRHPSRELTTVVEEQPAALERFLQVEKILCHEINPLRINTLEIELVLVGEWLDGYVPTCSHPLTARVLLSLSSLKNVQKFHIVSPVSLSLPENLLVQMVINMKNISSFTADNVGYEEITTASTEDTRTGETQHDEGADTPPQKPKATKLIEFLSDLKTLKILHMYDCLCVDYVWSEISWKSSLREIVLWRCPNLSHVALQRLSGQFSEGLKRIEVCTIGISEVEQIERNSPGYLWEMMQREHVSSFKSLRTLKLAGINMTEHLLRSFQDVPRLTRLDIDSPNIRAQSLFKFISKAPRLATLNCRVRGGAGSLDMIMHCLGRGVLLDESFY
ncbi:hypothetical protein PCANC_03398 [Puccinia coronata f. sp. avenae]|nr:hypothetical protein PCANC_03398 [Puccinia coronata f. sp. avenae]